MSDMKKNKFTNHISSMISQEKLFKTEDMDSNADSTLPTILQNMESPKSMENEQKERFEKNRPVKSIVNSNETNFMEQEDDFKSMIYDEVFHQHVKFEIHFKSPTGKYICEQCHKQFSSTCNLQKHSRIHTGEKPFACEQCDKKFSSSSNLQKHRRMHTGETPYVCEQCNKQFSSSSNLQKHSRIHTGETPYVCEQCDKQFSLSSNLQKHSRIHTGETPYVCEQCDKQFSSSSNLQKHSRIHTGATPYVCKQCDKQFSLSSNLQKHSRIHTGETSSSNLKTEH